MIKYINYNKGTYLAQPLQKGEWTFFLESMGFLQNLIMLDHKENVLNPSMQRATPATFSGNKVTQSEEAKLPFDDKKTTGEKIRY